MKFKKILPYLLLNVAVSAVTMLLVILIWNALNPSVVDKSILDSINLSPNQTTAIPLPPIDAKTIEIVSVFMPGEMDYEKISLKNVSETRINLSGWVLSNSKGDQFTFPAFTLYPNGGLDIYTKVGHNNMIELFWSASHAIWQSGQEAVLVDSAGNERFRFAIP
jgi:hypothetical protein